ncbi:MAG TPA: FmdE family protein [Rhodanobacteraceae bacterium]
MSFPTFFDQAPAVRVHDGLSELLGATPDGIVDYHYVDAVRLAGHSCPTVAGSYLMGRAALKALYGDDLPERGEIEVTMPDAEDAGVTGVMAQVITLLTGAAADNGFKGLGGRHARNNLLDYNEQSQTHDIIFRRRDTGAAVAAHLDLSSVPGDPRQSVLIGSILRGQPTTEERQLFAQLWQDRVRRLLERADDPEVICVTTA